MEEKEKNFGKESKEEDFSHNEVEENHQKAE